MKTPLVIALCFWALAAQGGVLRVRSGAAAGGDGSSWEAAFGDLQTALGAAVGGDELWVASGIYRPTAGPDRGVSFALKQDVAIYGGFSEAFKVLSFYSCKVLSFYS